jgi:hypothetical protein
MFNLDIAKIQKYHLFTHRALWNTPKIKSCLSNYLKTTTILDITSQYLQAYRIHIGLIADPDPASYLQNDTDPAPYLSFAIALKVTCKLFFFICLKYQ